jgi:hypothetical protein
MISNREAADMGSQLPEKRNPYIPTLTGFFRGDKMGTLARPRAGLPAKKRGKSREVSTAGP